VADTGPCQTKSAFSFSTLTSTPPTTNGG